VKNLNSSKTKLQKNESLVLFIWILAFIKCLVALMIEGNGWLGADGENYLKIVIAFENEGLFTDDFLAQYFSSGYSFLIYCFGFFTKQYTILLLVWFQILLFSYAMTKFWEFISEILPRNLVSICIVLIALNPTLTLSSFVIGYESILASTIMLFSYYAFRLNNSLVSTRTIFICGFWGGMALLVRPAIYPMLIVMIFFLALKVPRLRWGGALAIFFIISISPAATALRNLEATGHLTIGTSLGTTMLIGAGDKSQGNYLDNGTELDCSVKEDSPAEQDFERVKCAISWHIQNPDDSLSLSAKKISHLFSAWYGPLSQGTMARNPWLYFHPVKNYSNNWLSDIYFGKVGLSLAYLNLGFVILSIVGGALFLKRRKKELEAVILCAPILGIMALSALTVGDHRFRIPIIPQIIPLIIVALLGLWDKKAILRR
jgi:hypothetical protein